MKAYLVTLTGQGDTDRKLLNEEAWNFLINGGPVPDSVIDDYIRENPTDFSNNDAPTTRESVIALFADCNSSTADNDRALSMSGSSFNGEACNGYDLTINEINRFVKKHGLELSDEEYDGGIY